jgi:hypothetical protein
MAEITLIEPGVYLGPFEVAQELGQLEALNVTHIINVSLDLPCPHSQLTYKTVLVDDATDQQISHEFEGCNE